MRSQNWPHSSDLASWQPDLYEDFVRALPLPDYTRPDGVRNLASMVPLNDRTIEMGPKFFCSYSSSDTSQVGSVRLRTRAVDTLNVLAYAAEHNNQPVRIYVYIV